MKRISEYLLDLSEHHEKVAIPGFGTFHFENVSAQVSGFTELVPPGLKITFSSDFQVSPDVFIDYVAKEEGKSRPETEKFIHILVDAMLEDLQSSKTLDMGAIGTIQMDEQGEIKFKGGAGRITNANTFGLGKISTDLIASKAAKKEAKKEGIVAKEGDKVTPAIKQNEAKPEPVQKPQDLVDTPKADDQPKQNPLAASEPNVVKNKRKKSRVIRLVLIILLLLVLVSFGLAYGVYLCHYEPEQLGVDLCSKLEFLEPLGKFVKNIF